MYEDQTYDVILNRMLGRVSSKMDKREGAVIWDTHSPTAIELQLLYIELDNIIKEAYGDTASREFLILRCMERGITPYSATHAILQGEFTPPTVDVLGKRFNIGTINYVVTEKISDGIYQVQCETAGTVGNQYLGSMTPIDYVDGLETAELTEVLIPGEDDEDTEALRERYFASFNSKAFGGNRADYIANVNAIPGVGACKITRVWNSDIRPAEMIPDENVDSWYSSTVGTLTGTVKSWLETVYNAAKNQKLTTGGTVLVTIIDSEFSPASESLIQTVKETLDPYTYGGEGYGLAPIGHLVTVHSVDAVDVEVKTNITFESGYSWSNMQSVIDEVISDYLLELRQTWADNEYLVVRISQIETRILDLNGVVDIANTQINGAEENFTCGQYEVPVFGGASE